MQVSIYLTTIWHDEKLMWKPDDYDGQRQFFVDPALIWQPNIISEQV